MSFRRQASQHRDLEQGVKSTESLDITLSLSSPRPGGEVSWSSSEGSSYDTAEDLARIDPRSRINDHKNDSKHPRNPRNGIPDVEPPVLATKETSQKQQNVTSKEVSQNHGETVPHQRVDVQTSTHPKSRLLRPFSRTNPEKQPCLDDLHLKILARTTKASTTTATMMKKSCVLDNVDVYSAIELACGKEDMSAICFLSKEEADPAFSKRVIPYEISAQPAYDELSAVSTSIAGSTDSFSELDVWSQHAVHRTCQKSPSESQVDTTSSYQRLSTYEKVGPTRITLPDTTSVHSMEEIVISCQRTISSLESSATWDSQQDGIDFEGNGSEDAVRGPFKSNNLSCPTDTVRVSQDDFPFKIDRSTPRNLSRPDKPDKIMDERIRLLKEKIKNMQQESDIETKLDHPNAEIANPKTVISTGVESVSIESTVSGLPSEPPLTVTTVGVSRGVVPKGSDVSAKAKQQIEYSHYSSSGTRSRVNPIARLFSSSRASNKSSVNNTTVPSIVPTDEFEEVSLMESVSTSHFASTQDSAFDVESADRPTCKRTPGLGGDTSFCRNNEQETEWIAKFSENARIYTEAVKLWTNEMVVRIAAYARTQKHKFNAKSKSEKAVTVFIGSSLFVFLILLIALIA